MSKQGGGAKRVVLLGTDCKIDPAPMVGASLEVMDRDAKKMRGARPVVFTHLKTGQGFADVLGLVIKEGMLGSARKRSTPLLCHRRRMQPNDANHN